MTTKSGDNGTPKRDFPVRSPNWEPGSRANRLREAVKAAGGNLVVAQRAGVPLNTLGNYLRGRDMKATALISLAEACNVSLDWLATGRGSMQPRLEGDVTSHPVPVPQKSLAITSDSVFYRLDFNRLAQATEYALSAFETRTIRPAPQRLTELILILYDHLGDAPEAQRPKELAHILTAGWMQQRRDKLDREPE